MATILQDLDDLYVSIRGARYANALSDAKKAFQERDYVETLRLVRDTGELHRRMHLQALRQDPEKLSGGKKEVQKLLEKQEKIKNVLARFDALLKQLEKMAKLTPEKIKAPVSLRPQLAQETPANDGDKVTEQSQGVAAYIIDTGSFSQLQTAAQLTGLVPNADAIGFVRDHEFRTGRYQAAFERIEAIFMQLRSEAEQRLRKLRQEEHDYKSGTLKISPKQWMIKQQTDAAQSQKIDRTLRYFARILDGLRIMITSAASAPPQGHGPSPG